MRHVTRHAWMLALALVWGTAPAWAADAPEGAAGQTTPALRALDSNSTLVGWANDELFLIHPWDNPQRSDSTLGGPVSGLRPFAGERQAERTAGASSASARKASGTLPTGIDAVSNYPNPFNAQTTIQFRLVASGPVEISLFNLLGQSVRTMKFSHMESGTQSWTWDGLLEGGRPAPSGIYFYRVSSGSFSALQKMVLLK